MNNRFIRWIYYKILPFSIQAIISKIVFKPQFGNDMTVSRGIKFYYGKVSFGNGTRIAANSVFSNIAVGNYTVFAQDFRVLAFVHDYTAFSINSIIPSIISWKEKKELHEPNIHDYPQTVVGNDVWIGEFVTVKGGITIGDGAVVGARSVVTHDVPPFSIVAGVPARLIGWRFDEKKIQLMKDIQWWNWDKEKIKKNYERLCNFDESLREIN